MYVFGALLLILGVILAPMGFFLRHSKQLIGIGIFLIGAGGVVLVSIPEHHQSQVTTTENQPYQRFLAQFNSKEHVQATAVYHNNQKVSSIPGEGKYIVIGSDRQEYDVFTGEGGNILDVQMVH